MVVYSNTSNEFVPFKKRALEKVILISNHYLGWSVWEARENPDRGLLASQKIPFPCQNRDFDERP